MSCCARVFVSCRVAVLVCLAALVFAPFAGAQTPVDRSGRPLMDKMERLHYPDAEVVPGVESDDGWVAKAGEESEPGRYALGPWVAHHPGSRPEAVTIGDVTGDGRNDVVMTTTYAYDPPNDYRVFVYAQQQDGSLGQPTSYSYGATGFRNGLVLADLNEDWVLDVVVGHQSGISVLLADGQGGLEPAKVIVHGDAGVLAAMDVDVDRNADVISLGWSRGASILYGDGEGGFREIENVSTNASGYNDLEVEDVNHFFSADLCVMSGQGLGPNLSVHLHDGETGFPTPPVTYDMASPHEASSGLGAGDINGDGLNDLVLARGRNSPTYLWLMTQTIEGDLSGPTTIPTYDIPESVEVADLDNNSLEDIAVLHAGWYRIGIYLQTKDGLSSEDLYPIPYASHYAPQGLAVGDFSSDGCADVAIADYNNGLVVLYGSGACSLVPNVR